MKHSSHLVSILVLHAALAFNPPILPRWHALGSFECRGWNLPWSVRKIFSENLDVSPRAGDFPETQLAAWRNWRTKKVEMPGEAPEVQPGWSRSKSLYSNIWEMQMWGGAGSWKQRSSVFSARNGGPTESRQSVIFLDSSWDRQILGQQLNWNTNYTYHRKSSDMFTVFLTNTESRWILLHGPGLICWRLSISCQ